MTATRVLVVEDEPDIAEVMQFNLERAGFAVEVESRGDSALEAIRKRPPELVVLDLMIPGLDGLEIARILKRDPATARLPLVMLTAKGEELDRIVGLELGADDYVTKPFNPRELLARIRAILRRAGAVPAAAQRLASATYRFAGWTLDTSRRALVSPQGVLTDLTTGEFDLLVAFVEHPQRVLNRDQLLDLARGRVSLAFDRSIDNQVSRLRKKIEADPKRPQLIRTHWDGGYSFAAEVREA